jgi:hypothetical protein
MKLGFYCILMGIGGLVACQAEWAPAEGRIMTPWAEEVSPDNALPEYPRPMMVRSNWLNLNGLWDYAVVARTAARPADFDGKILVPFPIESALSGVGQRIDAGERLWYHRTFEVPSEWNGQRILLHFGGVDWETDVWVNGQHVGNHRGGHTPFSFDVTTAVLDAGEQEIVLAVWDPTDAGDQPLGKQVHSPSGIWYTPVSGIWQTVWLEPVPMTGIKDLKITPDVDSGRVEIEVVAFGDVSDLTVRATASGDGFNETVEANGTSLYISIPDARLWSPDDPFLYDLEVELIDNGAVTDSVESYFGMRKIEIAKDEHGINRLFLNNEPLFQYGLLDQGWWPDGLYTAPTDEALRYDVEITRDLGFNMLRKHVKIEPQRLYYWTDKLGVIVWQDMPSGDGHIGGADPDLDRNVHSATQFEFEYRRMIESLYNHPSIVMWVPFNEGWGQFDTERIVEWTYELDSTRLVNNASGWTDRGVGDVHDIHAYPGPSIPPLEEDRAVVLGEFGGLGLPVSGHTWQDEGMWGYRSYQTADELTDAYEDLLDQLWILIGEGLAAAVYTQTTDVEVEVNGLLTYDRRVIKMDPDRTLAMHERLYEPPPRRYTIVPDARDEDLTWRYTFQRPASGWYGEDFDDSAWQSGIGGFGTEMTPNAIIGTVWDGDAIWLRRTFTLDSTDFENLMLSIYYDEDAVVYINGVRAASFRGYVTNYRVAEISEEAKAALRTGENVIAIRCINEVGGQFIDAGLVEIRH